MELTRPNHSATRISFKSSNSTVPEFRLLSRNGSFLSGNGRRLPRTALGQRPLPSRASGLLEPEETEQTLHPNLAFF